MATRKFQTPIVFKYTATNGKTHPARITGVLEPENKTLSKKAIF